MYRLMDLMQLVQNPWLYVLLITMIPWIELRGSIPAGILLGLNPVTVLIVALAANILVIYPAFIFLDFFFKLMEKIPFMNCIINKTQRKVRPYVDKYGFIGLMLFVGVPLPGTGAYSGALAAHILGVKNKKAFLAIAAGVAIAGVLVTLMATVFKETLGWILQLNIL